MINKHLRDREVQGGGGAQMGDLVQELWTAICTHRMPDFRRVEPRTGKPNPNPVYAAAIQSSRSAGTLPFDDDEYANAVNRWDPGVFMGTELAAARRDLKSLIRHDLPTANPQGGGQAAVANTFNIDWVLLAVKATREKVRNPDEGLKVLRMISNFSMNRPLSRVVWDRLTRRSNVLRAIDSQLVDRALGIYACTASVNLSRLVRVACAVFAGGHPVVGVLNRKFLI